MANWNCECGGIYQQTGGDYNPIDTFVHMRCDKCGDKFAAFWMNKDYEYSIKRTKKELAKSAEANVL